MTSIVLPGSDKSPEIKKGHVCPPSNATHPADRWETAFVYTFICKFTKLKQEIDGFITVEDLEEALLFDGPHQILEQILARFMLNLRPQTRNIGPDVISSTVVAYFAEMFAKGERSNFWDEKYMVNIGPFTEEEGDYFKLLWDKKLRILRQLIEWQLCHSSEIKGLIDRAWGVVHMKHKKSTTEIAQETQELPDNDPFSRSSIITSPLGQDAKKRRYWAIDLTPRLYLSSNPWKVTASFTKIASTKEEYLKIIEDLKENAPPPVKEGERRQKSDVAHMNLIKLLESRIEAVDAEIQRVAKARKKFLQKQVAAAQVAEMSLRGTRTRRAAFKPDYVYFNGEEDEDEEDFNDDAYEDRMDDEADFINDDPLSDVDEEDYMGGYARTRRSRRAAATAGTERRRSTRSAVVNANGNRTTEWHGERRSARLGGQVDQPPDSPPAKRRRMTESTASSLHEDQMDVDVDPPKTALRPTEIALPQVAGKRKSKYWFYAVEPNPNAISTPVDEQPPIAGPSEFTEGEVKSYGAASNGNAPLNITTESLINGQGSGSPGIKAEVS